MRDSPVIFVCFARQSPASGLYDRAGRPRPAHRHTLQGMTSKYEEIAQLASKQSQDTWDEVQRCQLAGLQLANRLREFLQAPEGTFSLVKLDYEMRSHGEPHPLEQPDLTRGTDGFWYFGLRIHFAASGRRAFSDLTLKIGLRSPAASRLTVRYERDFEASTVSELDTFFEFIHRDFVESYSEPYDRRRQRPGFIE